MTIINFIVITVTFFSIFGTSIGQQYLDDTSFVGTWHEIEDGEFKRVNVLPDNSNGFVLTLVGELVRTDSCHDTKICSYNGSWWSLNIGHFSIQYENEAKGLEIIERFKYDDTNENIKRVDYEEYPLKQQSEFPGYWIINTQNTVSDEVIYVKSDDIGSSKFAFYLDVDGTGKIYKTNEENQQVVIEIIWWIGEEGDYIDMQFSNSMTGFINIEGFTIIPNTKPTQLRRTRFDELE